MKTSDLFVRALEHEGVEFLFGIPGEEKTSTCSNRCAGPSRSD